MREAKSAPNPSLSQASPHYLHDSPVTLVLESNQANQYLENGQRRSRGLSDMRVHRKR
jgi:hypothetical protein